MSVIETALIEATGVKPQRDGEARQKFLTRLMVGVGKLPEDEWEKLGAVAGAQDWYNTAADADAAGKPVPDFPDADAEDAGVEDEEAPAKKKPAKAAKPAKPAKETKPVKAAKPAKATSMRRALKRMIVKNPGRTTEELIAALEKQGYQSPSRLTISTIRADTRDTIKVLNEAGITHIEITDGRAAA
jgi:hypothetical protein